MAKRKNSKPTQAVIYTRYSPRRNAGDCESGKTQTSLCRELCASHGYEIAGEHHDKEISGKTKNTGMSFTRDTAAVELAVAERPGLWAAVDAMKRGMILVVWRGDRIARDVFLSELIHRQAKSGGWKIETVDGQQFDESPESTLMRHIFAGFAEYEKAIIAARTRATMQAMARAGRVVGNVSYGREISHSEVITQADGTKKTVRYTQECPAEQAVIRMVVRLRDDGLTLREIVDELNKKGIRPRGKQWHLNSVWRIIQRAGVEEAAGE